MKTEVWPINDLLHAHTTILCLSRVAQAYVNQRKLDHEVKTLQVQASQFSKQTAQWISMVEGFNQALKVRFIN